MFGCSKEPSHCDGSFDYPQQIWLRNKIIIFLLGTHNVDYSNQPNNALFAKLFQDH